MAGAKTKGSKPETADPGPSLEPAPPPVAGRVEGDAHAMSGHAGLPHLPPRAAGAPPLPAPAPKVAVGEPAPAGMVWVRALQQVLHAGGVKQPGDAPFLLPEQRALRLSLLPRDGGGTGHVEIL